MNKDKAVILCGIQGSGKGRMSERIMKEPNYVYVSTGDLCRSADPKTSLGKKVLDIMHKGILIDDDTINEMVGQKIKRGSNLVFDGYPRSIPQAEWLLEKLESMNFDIVAIFLEINETTAIARRDNRIAEMIAAGQEPRKDDLDIESLKKRFAEYREKTIPTIEFMRTKLGDNFYSIDTNGNTLEETTAIVANVLKI